MADTVRPKENPAGAASDGIGASAKEKTLAASGLCSNPCSGPYVEEIVARISSKFFLADSCMLLFLVSVANE